MKNADSKIDINTLYIYLESPKSGLDNALSRGDFSVDAIQTDSDIGVYNNERGLSLLGVAVAQNKVEHAKVLIEHGANVDFIASEGNHAGIPILGLARSEEAINLLLENGASVNMPFLNCANVLDRNLLGYNILTNLNETLTSLGKTHSEYNPIELSHLAASSNLFFKHGASLPDETELSKAIENRKFLDPAFILLNKDTAYTLMRYPSVINDVLKTQQPFNESFTKEHLLKTALEHNQLGVAKAVLDLGANPNHVEKYSAIDSSQSNFIYYAKTPEAIDLLVKYGADPQMKYIRDLEKPEKQVNALDDKITYVSLENLTTANHLIKNYNVVCSFYPSQAETSKEIESLSAGHGQSITVLSRHSLLTALVHDGKNEKEKMENGQFTGKVLIESSHHFAQNLGKGDIVIHEKSAFNKQDLDSILKNPNPVKIQYKEGQGQLLVSPEKSKNLSR